MTAHHLLHHIHRPGGTTRRRWLGQTGAALLAAGGLPGLARSARGQGSDAPATAASAPPQASSPPAPSSLALRLGRLPAPERIQRLFAAGPPAAVLLAALAPDKLMGWPMRLSDEARRYLSPPLAALPHLGRLTASGRGSTMPLEKLLALAPDLVLDAGAVDATYLSGMEKIAAQTGMPCVLVQGALAEHARQLREVGALIGVPARAQTLAAYADRVAALAQQVQASVPLAERPRVYYARGAGGLETGLDGSINVEVLANAAGRGGLTRVSLEQILAWDPQVIVTQDPDFARQVRQDPAWRGISAVQSHRVHCAPALPFGWLAGPPGINRLIGLRWLIGLLHPQHPALQTQPPLAEEAQRFYALFYGVHLSAADVRALLAAG